MKVVGGSQMLVEVQGGCTALSRSPRGPSASPRHHPASLGDLLFL